MVIILTHLTPKDRYADAHFHKRLQKLLNDFGKVFGARVIAVCVRPGANGQVMASM